MNKIMLPRCEPSAAPFPLQPCCNTKLEVDYRFPLHFYLLNVLSLFCGLLRATGLRYRGPLINNSVNIGGRDTAFFFFSTWD